MHISGGLGENPQKPVTGAISNAAKKARKALQEHTQAEIAYIEDVLVKDREKFLQQQEEILDKLDRRLQKRDATVMEMFAAVLEKVRERTLQERGDAQHADRTREAQQQEIARYAAVHRNPVGGVCARHQHGWYLPAPRNAWTGGS